MRALGRFISVAVLGLSLGSCGGIVVYPDEAEEVDETSVEGDGDADIDEDEGVDCSGAFGQVEVLFEDTDWLPQALSPTKDQLEFYYARAPISGGARQVVVRRRSSSTEPWGDPESVSETEGLCESVAPGTSIAALDVSGDGLRLYLGCNTFDDNSETAGLLLVAARADREGDFSVIPEPIGAIGYSLGLSRDELTAFGTTDDPANDEVLMYQRSSIFERFGAAQIAPGSLRLYNPEPAPGGLVLMGVIEPPTGRRHLVMTERTAPGEPFGSFETSGLPVPSGLDFDVSPALGADCRTLYFTRVSTSPAMARVMVARR